MSESAPKRAKLPSEGKKKEEKKSDAFVIWKPKHLADAEQLPHRLLTQPFRSKDPETQKVLRDRVALDNKVAMELQQSRHDLLKQLNTLVNVRTLAKSNNNNIHVVRDMLRKTSGAETPQYKLASEVKSPAELDLRIELARQQLKDAESLIGDMDKARLKFKYVEARPTQEEPRDMQVLIATQYDFDITQSSAQLGRFTGRIVSDLSTFHEATKEFEKETVSRLADDIEGKSGQLQLMDRKEGKSIKTLDAPERWKSVKHDSEINYGHLNVVPIARFKIYPNWDPVNIPKSEGFEGESLPNSIEALQRIKNRLLHEKMLFEAPYILDKHERKATGIIFDLSDDYLYFELFSDFNRDFLDDILQRPESLNKFIHLFFRTRLAAEPPASFSKHILTSWRNFIQTFQHLPFDEATDHLMGLCATRIYEDDCTAIEKMFTAVWYETFNQIKTELGTSDKLNGADRLPFLKLGFIDKLKSRFSPEEQRMIAEHELFRPDIVHEIRHFRLFQKLFCEPVPGRLQKVADSFLERYVASCRKAYMKGERVVFAARGVHCLTGITPPADPHAHLFEAPGVDAPLPETGFTLFRELTVCPRSCSIVLAMCDSVYWRRHIWFCSYDVRYSTLHSRESIKHYEKHLIRYLHRLYVYATDPSSLYWPVYRTATDMIRESVPNLPMPELKHIEMDEGPFIQWESTAYVVDDDAELKNEEFANWFQEQVADKKRLSMDNNPGDLPKFTVSLAIPKMYERHPERRLVKLRSALGSGRMEIPESLLTQDRTTNIVQLPLSKHAGVTSTILSFMDGKLKIERDT